MVNKVAMENVTKNVTAADFTPLHIQFADLSANFECVKGTDLRISNVQRRNVLQIAILLILFFDLLYKKYLKPCIGSCI